LVESGEAVESVEGINDVQSPELKAVSLERNLPPPDLVETSELKAVAPETKSTPAHLVEAVEAVVFI
jgi:hypothetical protein